MTHDNYWQHKLSLWLHDPVHKMFDIRRHESLATDLASLLNAVTPAKDAYQNGDINIIKGVQAGDVLSIEFRDGRVTAQAGDGKPAPKPRPRSGGPGGQGSLL